MKYDTRSFALDLAVVIKIANQREYIIIIIVKDDERQDQPISVALDCREVGRQPLKTHKGEIPVFNI